MATSSSDCGDNGYCIFEWDGSNLRWRLFENHAAEGFECDIPRTPLPPPPGGTLVLTCAEPASS